ncbi:MAG: hypothetical protein ABIJ61_13585 [bacterium]
MAEIVKEVDYFYAVVNDEPGEARKLLEFCSAHGVSLLNFTAFPVGEGKSQLDFFPEVPGLLKQAADEAGVKLVGPRKAFLIQGEERIGVLVEYYLRLADAGINVFAANGSSGGERRFGYVLWVNPEDYDRAAKLLGTR